MKEKTRRHYHAGWDHFTPPPGKEDKMYCRACCAEMIVTRDVNGPTSYAESISRGKHLHDSFACPNTQEAWHFQVIKLMMKIEGEISIKIASLLREEVAEILRTKKATKELWL